MVLYKPIRNTVHIMKIANTMVIIVPTVVLFLNISRESEVRSNVLNPVNSKSLTLDFRFWRLVKSMASFFFLNFNLNIFMLPNVVISITT